MHQDEKALNSAVGRSCKLDYAITFSDAQDLERVRRKLLKAGLILTSNVDVVRALKAHIRKVTQASGPSKVPNSLDVFDQYAASLEMHARTVKMLLKRLSGTSKLVIHPCPCLIEIARSLLVLAVPYSRVPTWRDELDDEWSYLH